MGETEITVQCFNTMSEIDESLKCQGWIQKNSFIINDWYFSALSLDTLKTLDYADLISNSFLVRQFIEPNELDEIQLCYKMKNYDKNKNVISETKIKTRIESLTKALQIFESTNLTMWCNTNNKSKIYAKGDMELCVQEVNGLGTFIEFEEFDSINNMNAMDKFNYLKDYIRKLNLKLGEDFSCKKVFLKFKNELQM